MFGLTVAVLLLSATQERPSTVVDGVVVPLERHLPEGYRFHKQTISDLTTVWTVYRRIIQIQPEQRVSATFSSRPRAELHQKRDSRRGYDPAYREKVWPEPGWQNVMKLNQIKMTILQEEYNVLHCQIGEERVFFRMKVIINMLPFPLHVTFTGPIEYEDQVRVDFVHFLKEYSKTHGSKLLMAKLSGGLALAQVCTWTAIGLAAAYFIIWIVCFIARPQRAYMGRTLYLFVLAVIWGIAALVWLPTAELMKEFEMPLPFIGRPIVLGSGAALFFVWTFVRFVRARAVMS